LKRSRTILLAIAAAILLGVAVVWMQGSTPQFYASEVEIRATADQVFPYLIEPEKRKQWILGLAEARPRDQDGETTTALPQVGAAWFDVIEREGKRLEIETEVSRVEKNQLLQVRVHAPSFDAVHHFDLTSARDGTKLTQNLTVTYRGLARFRVPFTKDETRQKLEADLRRLKQAVEHASPAPASPSVESSEPHQPR
jgi:uncharacterized protein YndB with AHSA1/START domain